MRARWWTIILVITLALAWQVPTWASSVSVLLEVQEPQLSLTVDPASLSFSVVSPRAVQYLESQLQVRNTGNVPIHELRASVDVSPLDVEGWEYFPQSSPPGPGKFQVLARPDPSLPWAPLPKLHGWTDVIDQPLNPDESLDLQLRLGLGPNLPGGSGRFNIVLRVIPQ